MNASNLFLRLEGYAQENFTTETLAYILETNVKIRDRFLDLLLSHRPKLRQSFRSCEIETQPNFDMGRPDLQITSTNEDFLPKIFVEVKTRSQEGKSQINKYLKHGDCVAYLTPLGFDPPNLDGKNDAYLGQFFWSDVYGLIKKANSHDVLHEQFLKYLEARHMGPPEPISQSDLRASAHAVDVIRKFQALINAVRKEVEGDWIQFGKNIGAKEICWGLDTGDLPYWWYRSKGWRKTGRRFYLCIGVGADKGQHEEPYFYLELGSSQKKFGKELESNRQFRKLCKDIGWQTDAHSTEWSRYKLFPLGKGNVSEIAKQQIKNVRSVSKETRRLVKVVESKL